MQTSERWNPQITVYHIQTCPGPLPGDSALAIARQESVSLSGPTPLFQMNGSAYIIYSTRNKQTSCSYIMGLTHTAYYVACTQYIIDCP